VIWLAHAIPWPRVAIVAIHIVQEDRAMKVVVDYDLCQSHGLCTQAAPEVFEIRDDGFLYLLDENPGEALRKKLELAVRECPTGAIKLEG
jgi:ferredoxin